MVNYSQMKAMQNFHSDTFVYVYLHSSLLSAGSSLRNLLQLKNSCFATDKFIMTMVIFLLGKTLS